MDLNNYSLDVTTQQVQNNTGFQQSEINNVFANADVGGNNYGGSNIPFPSGFQQISSQDSSDLFGNFMSDFDSEISTAKEVVMNNVSVQAELIISSLVKQLSKGDICCNLSDYDVNKGINVDVLNTYFKEKNIEICIVGDDSHDSKYAYIYGLSALMNEVDFQKNYSARKIKLSEIIKEILAEIKSKYQNGLIANIDLEQIVETESIKFKYLKLTLEEMKQLCNFLQNKGYEVIVEDNRLIVK